MDVNPHRGVRAANVIKLLEKTGDMIIVSSNGDTTTGCFNARKDVVVPPVIKNLQWLRPRPLLTAQQRTRFAYFRGMTTGERPVRRVLYVYYSTPIHHPQPTPTQMFGQMCVCVLRVVHTLCPAHPT